jgi:hypothetical protein
LPFFIFIPTWVYPSQQGSVFLVAINNPIFLVLEPYELVYRSSP